MAMTIETDGLTEVSEILTKLGDQAQAVAAGALYDGAGIVADVMKAAVNSIHAEPQRKKNRPPDKTPARWPTPEEKAALLNKTGIARFRKDGAEVDTLIGVTGASGYVMINGRKKAVREIARSINSGTSFMHKQPVFRKAKSISQSAAQKAIVDKAEKMFDEIINGK